VDAFDPAAGLRGDVARRVLPAERLAGFRVVRAEHGLAAGEALVPAREPAADQPVGRAVGPRHLAALRVDQHDRDGQQLEDDLHPAKGLRVGLS
jgi:hypothetical protein